VSPALDAARRALAGRDAWLVGGPVRDELLGRPVQDVDVAVAGDVEAAARAVAAAIGAAAFPLSETFGGWRVTARHADWQVDLTPLQGGSIEADLALRDFTLNAMARPLAGDAGALLDPHGGAADLATRRLRMVSPAVLAADPLRTVRAVRLACELGLEVDPETAEAVRAHAPGLERVAPERIFAELRRIIAAPAVTRGVALLEELGVARVVLPELDALHGVGQGVYHHLDVHGHTLEVLAAVVALEADPVAGLGPAGPAVAARLARPLADGFTGWGALRLAALLHDAAKPATRTVFAGERVGFPGHDAEGADLVGRVLGRLRASTRLRAHVADLTRHHLRLGFLVHEAPLPPRTMYAYLRATEPVTIDVTVLTVADRLATRGRKADEAIARHLDLAAAVLVAAVAWEEARGRPPLVRGNELARALGLRHGPELGRALAELEAARYAGEVATPDDAVTHARAWLARRPSDPPA
jgi:poly(A) polymerase